MSTSNQRSNNLSFLAWNINGLSSKSLRDKSQHNEFLDVINNFDFVILWETWPRSNVVEVRGVRSVTQEATQSRKGGRDSDGIVLLYKNTFHDWISILKKTCNFLWFKIDKDYPKTVKDIYTCGLYRGPIRGGGGLNIPYSCNFLTKYPVSHKFRSQISRKLKYRPFFICYLLRYIL